MIIDAAGERSEQGRLLSKSPGIYYTTLLGRFNERTRTITGAPSLKKDC